MVNLKIPIGLKKKLPITTTVFVVLFFIVLIRQEINFEYTVSKTDTRQQLQIISANVEKIFTQSTMNINGFRSYFEQNPDFDNPALTDYATRLFGNNNRIFKTVALTQKGIIKYIYPLKGNESALNVDLLSIPSQKAQTEKVFETGASTLLGPIKVIQGWEAFIFISSLHLNGNTANKPDGLVTITLDHKAIFAESGLEQLLQDYNIRLVSIERDFSEQVLYESLNFDDRDTVSIEIYPYDQHWKLTVYPIGGWKLRTDTIVAMMIIGILTALSTYYMLFKLVLNNERLDALVNLRTRDLISTNEELQTSLAINEERQAELELLNNNLENAMVELKYTEQKLRMVEKMNVISNLITGIAHRVNTPIGTIQTMISFIKMQMSQYKASENLDSLNPQNDDLIANIDESLSLIEKSTNKAIGIISSFKLLSSIKTDATIESVELKDTLKNIVAEVLSQKNIETLISIEEDCVLTTSKNIFAQAMTSVLVFISEYASLNENVTYTFTTEFFNNLCVLQLNAAPVKLPTDTVDKPFEPHLFLSADSKVTGLELFIAYELLTEVLLGDLRYSNTDDITHQFTFYIPNASENDEA